MKKGDKPTTHESQEAKARRIANFYDARLETAAILNTSKENDDKAIGPGHAFADPANLVKRYRAIVRGIIERATDDDGSAPPREGVEAIVQAILPLTQHVDPWVQLQACRHLGEMMRLGRRERKMAQYGSDGENGHIVYPAEFRVVDATPRP